MTSDSVPLLRTLMLLTLISGLVDAVSYLGLGRVFTANMTGNVVVLGFAAAGAPGFSIPASLTSLGAFLIGALCAGMAARRIARRGRLLLLAMATEAILSGSAATVAFLASTVASGPDRYVVIGVLAFAMGVRNATVRRMAVPDMTTTVLTMTLTGLAADSKLAGGTGAGTARRASAVAAMLIGAIAGAALYLHLGAGLPLAVAAVAAAGAATAFRLSSAPGLLDAAR
ncbi:MAG TPA: YoaK family protein [Streptosporangiaceae bacterium]|nr:YoaK family protein [Streptosporangiaceae bacterium]